MTRSMAGVNPEVLRWARERAGYTQDEVAAALGKDTSTIQRWEVGEGSPTYSQLEKLAYHLYKRPLAVFFFPDPPDEPDLSQEFRTLPDFELDDLTADTRYALRQGEAMQLALRELNDGRNPSPQKIFVDIQVRSTESAARLARQVRHYLDVPLRTQIEWQSNDQALQRWRDAVQDKGIFVFKRSLKQRDVCGFSLLDDQFPVIYLNNSTPRTRQIFTVFHELAHLLLHTNGVTKRDDRYISSLSGTPRRVEVFCNAFAAELLVPSDDFDEHLRRPRYDDQWFSATADRYHVSREVILRKLLDRGLIDDRRYREKADQWIRESREREARGGGNYYATQATYLGQKFLDLAFSRYYQGRCTLEQLADYLNVRVQSIPGLEQRALKAAAG